MAPQFAAERRHEPRVHTLNLVSVADFNEVGFRTDLAIGRTLDLSHDGMRLELSHALPLRSTVGLSLALGNQVVDVQGRVTSVAEVDEETCSMGVQFTDVSPTAYEALHEFLELRAEE